MADDPFATASPLEQQQALKMEAWHNEQKRRANDTIRVANPETITMNGKPFHYPHGDYYVKWEQGRHRVPINGTLDTTRYIARNYCSEMFVNIINYYGDLMGQELLTRVGREKPDVLLDKYLENKTVWDKVPKTDDERLMAEIYPQLWLGLVHEWGKDTPEDVDPRSGEVDLRTAQEKVLQNLDSLRISDTPTFEPQADLEGILPPAVPEEAPLYVSKAERARLAKELTQDD